MSALRPFFSFYGGKWRVARHYPDPIHETIIEPFAGSAGYSLRHPERLVNLYDADPVIAGVWDYLIHASESEVRSLPIEVTNVDEIDAPLEARNLIGFWLNKGSAAPAKKPSAWMRGGTHVNSFWGEAIKERIARQQIAIRHWTITCASYGQVLNREATWFIDPPYSTPAGRYYRISEIDYDALAQFAQSRRGQTIVCEQEGADWLPFVPFRVIKANESSNGRHRSAEVVWTNEATADEVAA